MPNSRPPAAELLRAIGEFLRTEVLPGLDEPRKRECGVAVQLLAVVERELELGGPLADAERRRLAELLGEELLGGEGPGGGEANLFELYARLSERLREGDIEVSGALIAALRAGAVAALRINNPRSLPPADR